MSAVTPTLFVVDIAGSYRPVTLREIAGVSGAALQSVCHDASVDGGWWTLSGVDGRDYVRDPESDYGKLLVCQKLALIHSEVSEALEGFRKGAMDDHLPDRPSIEVELADAVIRIGDLAGALKLDLGGAISAKMAYNRTRADHTAAARAAVGGKSF